MGFSKEHIKICGKAYDLQIWKYEQGFKEGDYIWNGECVCLCGMDYIQVKNYYRRSGAPAIQFALLPRDREVSFSQEGVGRAITINFGEYRFKILDGIGLWLPTQRQLQNIVLLEYRTRNEFWLLEKFNKALRDRREYYWQFNDIEQWWLAFTMQMKWDSFWNPTLEQWQKAK